MKAKENRLSALGLLLCMCLCLTGYAQIPKDGLVGYYMLDGNAEDSGPYGHHGTIIDDVSPDLDRFGNVGNACLFHGGYIDAGNPELYQLTEEMSISVWMKPRFMFNWGGIVAKWYDFGSGSFYLGVNPENQAIRWNLDMPSPIEGDEPIENEWVHIAVTYDGTVARMYENEVQTGLKVFLGGLQDVAENLYIRRSEL
jgi:hypothetical protein